MKYAIYDKAADGYLTKMEFDFDTPDNQMLTSTGYTEYITDAQLLDTKESAIDAITRIESCKFMEKGRFVIHSFDDTLKEQYIISEAGTPTKVIDSITVDLDGTINVKYGTMACHWSTASLDYAITRMNALQKAKSPIYTAWCNTFDIYKVIPVIDERSCGHYQFINVTTKGLEEFAKDEEEKLFVAGKEIINTVSLLNKRIEELEKANYKINKSFAEQAVVCAELRVKNTNLTKKAQKAEKALDDQKKLNDSNKATIAQMVVVKRAMNKELSDAADALEEVNDKNEELNNMLKEITDCVGDIMVATKTIDNNKMISNLTDVSLKLGVKTIDDGPIYGISVTLNILIRILKDRAYFERHLEEAKNVVTVITKERDKALERAEFYKRQANSVYGITMSNRCNGKQAFCDVVNGKKMLIDKEKYDSLLECINNISLVYEMTKFTPFSMDRPSWLSGIINRINNLTK